MTVGRQWLFRIIALLIPVIALLLLEGGLRLAGFGGKLALFIDNPAHDDYLLPRPDILNRYFPEEVVPRVTMEANFFLRDKPDNGLRIFVQGGSTAAGFPYGLGASLAGMLEGRLRQSYPQRQVEVVNTAMSAVNSYLLADLADEIVSQQPDAVLIYAGHNEYLGIFGVGSHFQFGGPWITRAYLNLYQIAIVDALQSLYYTLLPITQTNESGRTFMAQVASDTVIPFRSPRYQQGLQQFETNMRKTLSVYQEAGVPVFISTIASNVRDQPPLGSTDTSDYRADVAFKKGQEALRRGNLTMASQHLRRARDYDTLRFRAPSDINTIIRKLAQLPGVTLVDAEARLRQRSEDGIIGNTLMLEHLHPNVPGYFLLADTFYQALHSSRLATGTYISTAEAWRHRPLLAAEEYAGYAQIQALKADFPFSATPVPIKLAPPEDQEQQLGKQYFEQAISWRKMVASLRELYLQQGNTPLAIKATMLLADALPHDPLTNEQAADMLFKHQRHAEALHYYRRAERAGSITSHLTSRMGLLEKRLR
ncbi:SGNH/GDSL hydrolase family protein [Alteromonas sp. ASW11-19]|uniref:SGNH/GDSL hydrolase family protein n=1 Tax=Alteromonas salexigens TaxID=2982530 RepID=A0ABT2VLR5_9ALTE|nr:SGNH/GDSL hydrolase family protein [Alteromonas salexigens]MCU7554253.1 SGNH/GDSL hydrolase family protein [Alteromonas salexigens]